MHPSSPFARSVDRVEALGSLDGIPVNLALSSPARFARADHRRAGCCLKIVLVRVQSEKREDSSQLRFRTVNKILIPCYEVLAPPPEGLSSN